MNLAVMILLAVLGNPGCLRLRSIYNLSSYKGYNISVLEIIQFFTRNNDNDHSVSLADPRPPPPPLPGAGT